MIKFRAGLGAIGLQEGKSPKSFRKAIALEMYASPIFRASAEVLVRMVSSTSVLNSPFLILTPNAVGFTGLLMRNRE